MSQGKKAGWTGLFLILGISAFAMTGKAQSSGGTYVIERSVTAAGGRTSSGLISLDGAIGQAAAGTRSANQPLVVSGGFWTAPLPAPTASSVEIGGRILNQNGQGLRNAVVVLTAPNGEQRNATTGSFGLFHFAGVQAGETYVIEVKSRRYSFEPQALFVTSSLLELVFTGSPL